MDLRVSQLASLLRQSKQGDIQPFPSGLLGARAAKLSLNWNHTGSRKDALVTRLRREREKSL